MENTIPSVTETISMISNAFTFNPLEVEFLNGNVYSRKLPLSDSEVFTATFFSSLKIDRGSSVDPILLDGSSYDPDSRALVNNGSNSIGLDLAPSLAPFINPIGSFGFTYHPNYNGFPLSDSYISDQSSGTGFAYSRFSVSHREDGFIYFAATAESGNSKLTLKYPFSAVSDSFYRFLFTWDLENESFVLFANGSVVNSSSESYISSGLIGSPNRFTLGGGVYKPQFCHGKISNVFVYDKILYTSSYEPTDPLLYKKKSKIKLVKLSTIEQIINFSIKGDSSTRFIPTVNTKPMYYNGSSDWISSNESIEQSNSVDEIVNGLGHMNLEGLPASLGLVIWLVSDGYSRACFESFTTEYIFYSIVKDPQPCLVYGNVSDLSLGPLDSVNVSILGEPFSHGSRIVFPSSEGLTIDSRGSFTIPLIETESINHPISIRFQGSRKSDGTIPFYVFENIIIPSGKVTCPIQELKKIVS